MQRPDQHAQARAQLRFSLILLAMRGWSVALVALLGCDKLFDVDHVTAPPADAAVDAETYFDAMEQCPGSYRPLDGAPTESVYLWVPANNTWEEAEADCEADTIAKITHLVVFEDVAEMVAIRAELNSTIGTFNSHTGYARNTAGDPFEFFSVTGDALPRSGPPWNANEPTGIIGVGEETTTRFESFRDLTDQPWNSQFNYLCECDHRRVTKTFTLH